MTSETWPDEGAGSLGFALRRLDQALDALERRRSEERAAPLDASSHGGADVERRRLEAELAGLKVRERTLEEVAAEASAALGRAAAEVRAALAAEER